MVELVGPFPGPVLAADSKKHYKEWFDSKTGEKREFRGLLGVVVNPYKPAEFDEYYDTVLQELLRDFELKTKRSVLNSKDIGDLLAPSQPKYMTFCLNFARKMWDAPDTKITYVVTRINPNALVGDKKIIVHGEYGSATKAISIPEFLDLIEPYYNVLATWHVLRRTGLKGAYCALDGTDVIANCEAWRELSNAQHAKIIYNGDRTIPAISTADILLRSMDFFLQQRKEILDESLLRKIVTLGVNKPNLFFEYLGNPDIQRIKPLSKRYLDLRDLREYVQHPIIFVSAGGIPGQSVLFEGTPGFHEVMRIASGMGAGVRFFDPARDKLIIGRGEREDYFVCLNDLARSQFQALESAGINLKELRLSLSK
jgi:hypothetical protein